MEKNKENNIILRHILKTISYRVFGTFITVSVAYLSGVPIHVSALIGVGELLIKPIFYFLHERFWYKFIHVGRKKVNRS
jgi:uncharacterized membrane protein